MATQILATKLNIPPARLELVSRSRLIDRLNLGLAVRLTLISAPAGFGKTTLVSDWIENLRGDEAASTDLNTAEPSALDDQPPKVTWLSIDANDNDPIRFFSYFIAALQKIDPEIGQSVQSMLQASQLPSTESLMTAILNDIAASFAKFSLVLDDYQLIDSETIHEALGFLLEHLPPQMHLIVTGRSDPPLPLARLRARGQMIELGLDELRFTTGEAAAFLNKVMKLDLRPQDVARLEARTEGWITGLQLAALSLQGQADEEGLITAFTGKDRYIVDYLLEEVLRRQPETVQTFLLQTSILDRLCGPLCEAVVYGTEQQLSDETVREEPGTELTTPETSDGQETLERLEKSNLFIVPLDNQRQWYRYHQLFAEFLTGYLRQKQAGLLPELHRRAAVWYSENDLLDEAIEQILAAGDFEQAAGLIEQAADTTLRERGEIKRFLSWFDTLPEYILRSRPRLCLDQAFALFFTGQWDRVESRLEDVEEVLRHYERGQAEPPRLPPDMREIQGEIAALRSELALFQENTSRALELSEQALADLPRENRRTRGVISQIRGYIFRLNGDVTRAGEALVEATALSEEVGSVTTGIFALCDLAEVQIMQGRLREAASTYQRVMDFASEHRAWPFPPTGAAYVGMGNLLREWNELETAGQHLHKGIELSKQGGYSGVMSQGYQYLALMKLAQGEVDEASTLLQTAEELVRRSGAHQQRSRVQALRVQLWLVQGNLAAAVQWATDLEHNGEEKDFPPAYQRQLDRTIQVRVRLAQGEPDMAAIDTLLEKSGTAGWRRNEIELVMLKAVALETQGDTGAAILSLAEALAMAEPEAYIRLFVDEGAAVAKLLRLAVLESISPTYVGRLQASFMPSMGEGLVSSQALIDPLTKRELKVLQLMADGLSNREIADELVIALGTVAKYSNNIFTKLNVRNRTQAISRARILALI